MVKDILCTASVLLYHCEYNIPMALKKKKSQLIVRRKPQRRFKLPKIKLFKRQPVRGESSKVFKYTKFILAFIGVFIIYMFYQSVKIQGYVVYGNSRVNIPSNLDQIKGESLFSNVEGKFMELLAGDSDKVENVNIVKKIGGQVIIELIEKSPQIAYLNIDGIKLIDGNGKDVGSLGTQKFDDISNYTYFNGTIENIDDDRVVRRYLEVNKDVEGAKTWSDLDTEERKAFIQQQKDFYIGLWNNYINTQKEAFNASNYRDLNIIVNRSPIEKGDLDFDSDFIKYVIDMKTFLTRYEISVSEIRYRDIVSFSFITSNGKELIFRKNKLITEQQQELGTFLGKVGINNGTTFDFRGEIISVK
jgi:cell division septal protein FtsQ